MANLTKSGSADERVGWVLTHHLDTAAAVGARKDGSRPFLRLQGLSSTTPSEVRHVAGAA